jgi:hypothetical protein
MPKRRKKRASGGVAMVQMPLREVVRGRGYQLPGGVHASGGFISPGDLLSMARAVKNGAKTVIGWAEKLGLGAGSGSGAKRRKKAPRRGRGGDIIPQRAV